MTSLRPRAGVGILVVCLFQMAVESIGAADHTIDVVQIASSARTVRGEDAVRLAQLERDVTQSFKEGRYAEARVPARQVLEIRARVQGHAHWQTLTAKSNLLTIETIASLPPEAQAELDDATRLEKDLAQLEREGRYREAIPVAARIGSIRQQHLGDDNQLVAKSIGDHGVCLYLAGNYAEAEVLFRKALAITQRALGETHPDTAACDGNLALSLQRQDRFLEAQSLLQDALAIQQTIHGPDHPATAVAYTNLATNLDFQGEYDKAEPLYRQALNVLRRVHGEEHERTAIAHNNLGFNLHRQAKDTDADREYQESLQIRLKLSGTSHPDTALVLNNLAVSLADQGKYAEAEPLYRQALETYRPILGEDHPQTLSTYSNLALALGQQGKLLEAELLFRMALDQQSKSVRGDNLSTATWCTNLADNLNAQGRYPEAKELLDRALEIHRRILGENHIHTAQSYNNVAAHFYKMSDYERAEPLLRDALTIFKRQVGDQHPLTAMACGNLAVALHHQGKYAEAEPLAKKSLETYQQTLGEGHPNTAWAFRNSATLSWAQGNYESAEEYADRAAASFDAARTRISFAGLGRAMFAAENTPWPLLAAVAARNGKPRAAWRALESGLARGLLDDLSARPLTDDERAHELTLLNRLNRIEGLVTALDDGEQTDLNRAKVEQLKTERDDVQSQMARLQSEMARKYGTAVGEAYDLRRLQAQIADNVAILTWVDLAAEPFGRDPNGDHWACIIRRHGDPTWIRLAGTGPAAVWTDDDEDLAVHLRQLCSSRPSPTDDDWLDVARRLYAQRLSPVEELLATDGTLPPVKHLVILPSEQVRGIPVESLTDRFTVSYAPSGTIFAWLQEQRATRAEETPAMASILAVGDPIFASATSETNLSPRDQPVRKPDDSEFSRLQAAQGELEAVTRYFRRATVLAGANASRQQLDKLAQEDEIRQFRYLHFATHGILDQQSPMRSALILAQSPSAESAGNRLNDERLTADQILRTWRLDADLVTLSACDTGLGQYSGGEGYLGFSQALFLSGARSLVLSLWQVDDTSTALLMARFYENLVGTRAGRPRMTKATALAEAKMWLRGLDAEDVAALTSRTDLGLDTERTRGRKVPKPAPTAQATAPFHPYAHPYYWSGFILIGDPN